MKRGRSTGSPTKADAARFQAIQRIGCIVCGKFSPCEIHHLLSGGRRKGHRYTIGLCPHHHRGAPPLAPGPSLAAGSKPFHKRYGSDAYLLSLQDWLIGVPGPTERPLKATGLSSSKILPRRA